ncbi:hypothetical protein ACTTAI_12450 [Rhodobacter capsulatus]|uniref:hypothetical protein n=1 Tax=Rhodobacter capsulatus TaxID=1061 RepID=UPI0040295760
MRAQAGHVGAIGAGALAACLGLPGLADAPDYSLRASGNIPDLSRHLRMSEGVRGARVDYYGQVMTGGQHCAKNAKGVEECVFWDGFLSAFEVEYEGVTETRESELKKGVLLAIDVVCPSSRAISRDPSEVQRLAPGVYRLDAACPRVNERMGY